MNLYPPKIKIAYHMPTLGRRACEVTSLELLTPGFASPVSSPAVPALVGTPPDPRQITPQSANGIEREVAWLEKQFCIFYSRTIAPIVITFAVRVNYDSGLNLMPWAHLRDAQMRIRVTNRGWRRMAECRGYFIILNINQICQNSFYCRKLMLDY